MHEQVKLGLYYILEIIEITKWTEPTTPTAAIAVSTAAAQDEEEACWEELDAHCIVVVGTIACLSAGRMGRAPSRRSQKTKEKTHLK